MPTLPKINSIRVPADGPRDAKIVAVGEAPGKDEEIGGDERRPRPFIGKSGSLMTRYLQDRAGIRRSEVFCTNLCKFRPHKNEFKNCLGTPQLEEGLAELKEDILEIRPNLVIAFGAWPLYYLTGKCGTDKEGRNPKPGTGIGNWRGSVIPSTLVPDQKVLAIHHPAYISRNWGWHPVFSIDLEKAKRESEDRDFHYPVYESIIDPLSDVLGETVLEMARAEFLTVDIETFPDNTMSCIGFSDRTDRGLCITYENPSMVEVAEELLASTSKKIFQYGTFDRTFLKRFYNLKVNNFWFDTYVAAASLMPEFPRRLDFLTSIYTDFPFYKEERKLWKQTGDMTRLWEYNISDCVATGIIAREQMKELEKLFGHPVRVT